MTEPVNGIDVSQPLTNDTPTVPVTASSSVDNQALYEPSKASQTQKKPDNGSQSGSSTRSSKRGRKGKNKETKNRKVDETADSEFDTGREEEIDLNEAILIEAFNRLHKRIILLEKSNAEQKSKIATLEK